MMEHILNAFWLILAWSSVAWLFRREPGSKSRSLIGLIALSCVLMLLFPVISVSDDLHSSSFAIEESQGGRKQLRTVELQKHIALHAPGADLLATSAEPVRFCLRQALASPLASPQEDVRSYSHAVPDRAPPALL